MSSLPVRLEPEQLAELADLVADRLADRLGALAEPTMSPRWIGSRAAAHHVGMSLSELQRAASAGAVPHEQDGPNARLYFRTEDLDAWMRAGRPGRPQRRRRAKTSSAAISLPRGTVGVVDAATTAAVRRAREWANGNASAHSSRRSVVAVTRPPSSA